MRASLYIPSFFIFAGGIATTHGLSIAITGSSQGIGLEAAKRLIADGHTVFHACRNQERANVAVDGAGGGIPLVCDLEDFESVRNFAETLKQEAPKLDVLCLNAGVAPSTKATKPKLTKDGFEQCIGTNHLGHFLLANILSHHLEKNGGLSRLVVTASSVHDPETPGGSVRGKGGATLGGLSGFGIRLDKDPDGATMPDGANEYDGMKVYNDSKLCNVLFCREALKRWGGKLAIRSFSPGFIPSSGLFRAPREDNWLGATAFTLFAGLVGFAVPIEVGGERLAYMATSDDTEVPSGSFFSADKVGSKATIKADGFDDTVVSKEALDNSLASKLWDRSTEIVGV